MKILPLLMILTGVYVFYRKRETNPADNIYDLIYKLVGAYSILLGIFVLGYKTFLRKHSIDNGYYDQLFFIRSTAGSIWIGLVSVWALIETKLQKRQKLAEETKTNPNKSSDPM